MARILTDEQIELEAKQSAISANKTTHSDQQEPSFERYRARLETIYANRKGSVKVDIDPDPEICPECGSTGFVKVDPDAAYFHPDFGKIKPCENALHADDRRRRQAKLSGLSEREIDLRLADLQVIQSDKTFKLPEGEEVTRNGKKFDSVYRSNKGMLDTYKRLVSGESDKPPFFVYVWGPHGGGKTTAAIALVNELNLAGRGDAMYITLPDLLQGLKDSFDDQNKAQDNRTESQKYVRLQKMPNLVIDEFDFADGKVGQSNYNLQLLQRLVDHRYRTGITGETLTVYISNSPVNHIGIASIVSRLKDTGSFIVLDSAPDLRQWSE